MSRKEEEEQEEQEEQPRRLYVVPVLSFRQRVLDVRGHAMSSSEHRELEAFLDRVPAESNYISEMRLGWSGFSLEFAELDARRQSKLPLRQHIQVEKLIPQCEISLSQRDFDDFESIYKRFLAKEGTKTIRIYPWSF